MTLTKYICLDDESLNIADLITVLCQGHPELEIDVRSPSAFDAEVQKLGKDKLDGLLLDLRLDKNPDDEGNRVSYRAISLAQELRTRMTEKNIRSFPIILWSVDGNFQESYDRDKTGHDLFDLHFSKQHISDGGRNLAEEMVALSQGYEKINVLRSRTINNIYARIIDLEKEFDVLDARLANEISSKREYPTHVFADSVLNDLIRCTGVLIDEKNLAARLGVDIDASVDWGKLKKEISSDCLYTGVFGCTWPRWWMFKVSRWWELKVDSESILQRITAEQRVAVLKRKFKLKELYPLQPVKPEYDTRFWHVCYLTGKPISMVNAVRLSFDRKEWQDGVFASMQAILDRVHKHKNVSIHPFELERVKIAMGRE